MNVHELAVREFATDLIHYEDEHASGPETTIIRAIAGDILAILDGDDQPLTPPP